MRFLQQNEFNSKCLLVESSILLLYLSFMLLLLFVVVNLTYNSFVIYKTVVFICLRKIGKIFLGIFSIGILYIHIHIYIHIYLQYTLIFIWLQFSFSCCCYCFVANWWFSILFYFTMATSLYTWLTSNLNNNK